MIKKEITFDGGREKQGNWGILIERINNPIFGRIIIPIYRLIIGS